MFAIQFEATGSLNLFKFIMIIYKLWIVSTILFDFSVCHLFFLFFFPFSFFDSPLYLINFVSLHFSFFFFAFAVFIPLFPMEMLNHSDV